MNCKTCSGPCCLKGSNHEGDCEGYKPQTNLERIKAMGEELATFAVAYGYCPPGVGCHGKSSCKTCWLDWLRSEEKEGE